MLGLVNLRRNSHDLSLAWLRVDRRGWYHHKLLIVRVSKGCRERKVTLGGTMARLFFTWNLRLLSKIWVFCGFRALIRMII